MRNDRKNFLTHAELAVVKGCWNLQSTIAKRLDHFFLQHDDWKGLEKDFWIDQQEVKRFLRHEGRDYEVICLAPVPKLQAAIELGLSFRVHGPTNTRVVLVKEWEARAALNEILNTAEGE